MSKIKNLLEPIKKQSDNSAAIMDQIWKATFRPPFKGESYNFNFKGHWDTQTVCLKWSETDHCFSLCFYGTLT